MMRERCKNCYTILSEYLRIYAVVFVSGLTKFDSTPASEKIQRLRRAAPFASLFVPGITGRNELKRVQKMRSKLSEIENSSPRERL